MDNDNVIKKTLVKAYRNMRLRVDYADMGILSEKAGNRLIAEAIRSNAPFMVGRMGAVEMRCVSKWLDGRRCTTQEREQALLAAGIFPNNNETIERFCEIYVDSMSAADILGVWEVAGERKTIKKYCLSAKLIPSRSIEPYYFDDPWSKELEGKRILIIHPFIKSIEQQLLKRKEIWNGKEVLPEFKNVSYIKAVQSNAGGKTDFEDWFSALDYMKRMIQEKVFDVAIIGAGAYGLPLAAHCKKMGRQVIQMAGATQILFGIKGHRWDHHPVISKFYNKYWIRPGQDETPPQFQKVEGGSYW